MKKKKTRRLYLRLTEEELTEIRCRSKKFDSITHFVFSSIKAFNDTTVKEKMETRKRLAEYYSKADQMLAHVGGNLNQAMRQVNEAAKVGHPTQALILNRLMPEIIQCQKVCIELRNELLHVTGEYAIL